MHSGSSSARNRSEDSHCSHHSHPHHHRDRNSSERRSEDSHAPCLVRISIDLLTGGKSITAVMDPRSTVLDLKQRIHVRSHSARTT